MNRQYTLLTPQIPLQADKNHCSGSGYGHGSGLGTSVTEWKTVFLVFSSVCLHLPCFYKFPPYKGKLSTISIFRCFIAFGAATTGGRANLCPQFGKKKKKKIPTPIRAALGACICRDAHTCNMTERLSGQHFGYTPPVTQCAAVFSG